MKYKVGDKVRVKSLEWYTMNKDEFERVRCNTVYFQPTMSKLCDSILTIKNIDKFINAYIVEENSYYWTDDMFEGLAENTIQPVVSENIVFLNENYADKVELCLGDDYKIVVEDGRTFVQKKKPKYPKTYEECCGVLGISYDYPDIKMVSSKEYCLYSCFIRLIRCRDAYWKIAGYWKPDWADNYQKKWIINFYQDEINLTNGTNVQFILAFPTEEIRNAFYKNFKELIEKCINFI